MAMLLYDYPIGAIILSGLILACALSTMSLLAIWAGLSRRHWFLRAAVVLGAISLLVPARAYEAIVFFLLHAVMIITPLALIRRWRDVQQSDPGQEAGKNRFARFWVLRFSLQDMFLATVVIAVVMALSMNVWKGVINFSAANIIAFCTLCALCSLLALLATWFAIGRSLFWLRLATFGLVMCLASFLDTAMIGYVLIIVLSLACGKSSGFFQKLRTNSKPSAARAGYGIAITGWRQRLAACGAVLLTALVLLPTCLLYWKLVEPIPIPQQSLPNPNGYDLLLQAARKLGDLNTGRIGRGELKSALQPHDAILADARVALDLPSRVPIDYSPHKLEETRDLDHLSLARELARAFVASGSLAELDAELNSPGEKADYTQAADWYLDTVRLGRQVSRGGLLVDYLVGIALERMGIHSLGLLRSKLEGDECGRLIRVLEAIDSDREPSEDIIHREHVWSVHQYGWFSRLLNALAWFSGDTRTEELIEPVYRAFRVTVQRRDAMHRLLMAELAIRAYRLDHGTDPQQLEDLVPDYLTKIPKDPYSGQPLIYRRQDESYLLYSVGENERDDGGERMTELEMSRKEGDLFLDIPEPPEIKGDDYPGPDVEMDEPALPGE